VYCEAVIDISLTGDQLASMAAEDRAVAGYIAEHLSECRRHPMRALEWDFRAAMAVLAELANADRPVVDAAIARLRATGAAGDAMASAIEAKLEAWVSDVEAASTECSAPVNNPSIEPVYGGRAELV